jgi:hypothetical protein
MARSTRCAVICFSTSTSLEARTDPVTHQNSYESGGQGRADPTSKGGTMLMGRGNQETCGAGRGLPAVGEEEDALQHSAPFRRCEDLGTRSDSRKIPPHCSSRRKRESFDL